MVCPQCVFSWIAPKKKERVFPLFFSVVKEWSIVLQWTSERSVNKTARLFVRKQTGDFAGSGQKTTTCVSSSGRTGSSLFYIGSSEWVL